MNDTNKKQPFPKKEPFSERSAFYLMKAQREEKLQKKAKAKQRDSTNLIIAIGLIVVPPIIYITSSPKDIIYMFLMFYAVIPFWLSSRQRVKIKILDEEVQDIDFEIDLLQFPVSDQEIRAEKLLRINRAQLRRYYDLNLNQNIWVFAIGIFCILLGFVVIGVTFHLISKIDKVEPKIVTAAVGAIGSILANYIAAIYLKMHAAAATNLSGFHSRLVETHEILIGNLLASRIEDKEKRWETLSQLSVNVAQHRKA